MMDGGWKLDTNLASWPWLVQLGCANGMGERMGRRKIWLWWERRSCQNPRPGGSRPRFLQRRGGETSEEAPEVLARAVLNVDNSGSTSWGGFHGDYPLGKKCLSGSSGRI